MRLVSALKKVASSVVHHSVVGGHWYTEDTCLTRGSTLRRLHALTIVVHGHRALFVDVLDKLID